MATYRSFRSPSLSSMLMVTLSVNFCFIFGCFLFLLSTCLYISGKKHNRQDPTFYLKSFPLHSAKKLTIADVNRTNYPLLILFSTLLKIQKYFLITEHIVLVYFQKNVIKFIHQKSRYVTIGFTKLSIASFRVSS